MQCFLFICDLFCLSSLSDSTLFYLSDSLSVSLHRSDRTPIMMFLWKCKLSCGTAKEMSHGNGTVPHACFWVRTSWVQNSEWVQIRTPTLLWCTRLASLLERLSFGMGYMEILPASTRQHKRSHYFEVERPHWNAGLCTSPLKQIKSLLYSLLIY